MKFDKLVSCSWQSNLMAADGLHSACFKPFYCATPFKFPSGCDLFILNTSEIAFLFLIFACLHYPEDSIARDCKGLVCCWTTVSSLASLSFQHAGFFVSSSLKFVEVSAMTVLLLWDFSHLSFLLASTLLWALQCNPLIIQTWHPSYLTQGPL